MVVAYVDSSVFVKLFDSREPGADAARRRIRASKPAASVLLLPEVMSALARKLRLRHLRPTAAARLRAEMEHDYSNVLKVQLTQSVLRETTRLLFSYPLRAGDAIHLASAVVLGRTRDEGIAFLTADEELAEAATSEGLEVERFG
ncbi:MAG: type II toxin-antitoxin system VapC family toxin [Actinomycetota bacterium]